MPDYRRLFIPGHTYFFTAVTGQRRRILTQDVMLQVLKASIVQVRQKFPFKIVGMVLLPDHMHTIWTMPKGDCDFSVRWRLIKARVTRASCGIAFSGEVWNFHDARRCGVLWQPRFWEHAIRDDADLEKHLDYLHWNPVKHGLVTSVRDWPWSSFHRYVRLGYYPDDWCASEMTHQEVE